MKALTAYFSPGSGKVTKSVAERLAKAAGTDLYEIVPEIPYTEADLEWTNKKCRSTLEMKDRSARPAIAGSVEDMEAYDVVFIGFPVWWYREPSIIDTFMEAYDFTGKTVVPFATSGGSGIGPAGELMQELAPGAKVLAGQCFPATVTDEELSAWAGQWLA